jgi:hypothetical protein
MTTRAAFPKADEENDIAFTSMSNHYFPQEIYHIIRRNTIPNLYKILPLFF